MRFFIGKTIMKKLTQQEVKNRFKYQNLILIDTYVNKRTKVLVRCSCGNNFKVFPSSVFKKEVKSCGHCNDPKIGDVFGNFTIIKVHSKSFGCSVEAKCVCGHVWKGMFNKIKHEYIKTCGYCNNPKIGDRYNKLVITKVQKGYSKGCKVECLCECGNLWNGYFSQIKNGLTKSCGCLLSHGELLIKNFLDLNNIQYIQQKKFDDCKDKALLRFDFYLPKYNMLIEFQGKQHYENGIFGKYKDRKKLLLTTKKHDRIKKQYCKNNNIILLEIKYTEINKIGTILTDILLS